MFARGRLLIVLAALSACSGGGGDGPLAAEEYCEVTAGFFCDFYLRCGRMNVTTRDDCLSAFAESCNGRYELRYGDLEAAGLLELSREGVRACEEHLQSVSCAQQVLDLSGPCRDMWLGLQPTGGACSYDIESFVCEPGSECVLGLDLCGECRPAAVLGDACGDGVTCGADAACVGSICVARQQVGDGCGEELPCVLGASCADGTCAGPTYVGEGDTCDQTHRCPYLTSCIGGTCVATSSLGGVCASDGDCSTGYCDSETCVQFLLDGASCERSAQCASAMCVDGFCSGLPSACFD